MEELKTMFTLYQIVFCDGAKTIPDHIGLLVTPRENETAYSLLFTHNNADFSPIHYVTDRSRATLISKVKSHAYRSVDRYSDRCGSELVGARTGNH